MIEGFDVSASTLFVINRRGEMFTRMVDFDTIGSDTMFFQYSYDPSVRDKDVIAIPGEEWLPHTAIPLQGQAKISSLVTIALNGQHNSGRELRVAGLEIPASRVLHVSETSDALGPAPGAPSRNVAFQGRLIIPGPPSASSRRPPVSPITLRLTEGNQSVEVKLHLVEEWYHLKRNDPGRDGTPRKLMGTLEIAPETRARAQGRLAEALTYLQPHHRRSLGLWVEATDNYLVARVKSLPNSGRVPDIRLELRRDGGNFPSFEHAIHQALVRNGFSRIALDAALRVDETGLETFEDSTTLRGLIEKNRKALRLINQWVAEPVHADARTPFYISSAGFPWVNGLFQILRWHEKVRTISDNLGPLIAINDELSETILFSTTQDAQAAKRIILTRISAYELRLADLANVPPRRSSFVYRETPSTAWEPFRFGGAHARVTGMMNRILAIPAGCSASIEDADVVAGDVDPFSPPFRDLRELRPNSNRLLGEGHGVA